MRRFSSVAAVAVAGLAVALPASFGLAAEDFACGPGGKPNPSTAKCDCPPGKIEKTTGGVSRCIAPPPSVLPPPGPKPSTTASTASTTPSTTPSTAPSTPPTSPPPETACNPGQTADAAGHCCYPGQVWGESSGRCRGKPQCPAGLVEENETCVARCDEGMIRVGNELHCCWPSQEWSSATNACVGEASCPSGFEPRGDGCARTPPTCDEGKIAIDDRHCCWAGQTWSKIAGEEKCAGAPSCPPSYSARGDDCIGPEVVAKENEDAAARAHAEAVADASALWGAGLLTFGLYTAYQRAPGAFNSFVVAYHLGVHLSAIPIAMEFGAGGGGYWTTVAGDSASGSVGDLFTALSLAPISFPNAARMRGGEGASWLNPSFGFELHRFGFQPGSTSRPVPGLESTAAGLVTFGDTIQLAYGKHDDSRSAFVLRVAYGYGVLGNDFSRGSRISLVISAGAW